MRTLTSIAAAALLVGGGLAPAGAETLYQRGGHPRRVEVNSRLHNQNQRIDREYREGDISAAQAHAMHQQDDAIGAEERAMAHGDASHITRSDQRLLNQQEGAVSHEIGQ